MTRDDLTAIIDGTTPITRTIARALANTLVNVLTKASVESAHADSAGQGHPYVFGYSTACRVLTAVIDETNLA